MHMILMNHLKKIKSLMMLLEGGFGLEIMFLIISNNKNDFFKKIILIYEIY